MKKSLLFALLLCTASANAVTVISNDSLVTLAGSVNGTKNYTFLDIPTGESVTIELSMTATSPTVGETFSLLDGDTRLGIGADADGNHIDGGEGVAFTATLVSATAGVELDSIEFRIAALGIRSTGAPSVTWASSATTSFIIPISSETVYTTDSLFASLDGVSYIGSLGIPSNRIQLSNSGAHAGQSLQLETQFTVPEPSSLCLAMFGALAVCGIRRRGSV